MNITEFAKSRNQSVNTVSKYCRENADLFAGHIEIRGKQRIIDDIAFQILDKKYPLPSMMIVGVPEADHLRALSEKDEIIARLQQLLIESKTAENKALLELSEAKTNIMLLGQQKETENEIARKEAEAAKKELAEALCELEKAKEEICHMESRSLLQRIFNKK